MELAKHLAFSKHILLYRLPINLCMSRDCKVSRISRKDFNAVVFGEGKTVAYYDITDALSLAVWGGSIKSLADPTEHRHNVQTASSVLF